MSAYALPGFFPPLETSFASYKGPCEATNASLENAMDMGEVKVNYELSSRPVVTVLRAKVDPIRLIESLTAQRPKRIFRRRRCSDTCSVNPQECAMEFELSLETNGRVTTVVRTMESIRQLRKDLLNYTAVPELPALKNDCLGFTLMHDALRVYSPLLAQWFRDVLPHVESSNTWSDFWYPDTTMSCNSLMNSLLRHRMSAPVMLHAIEESETESDDDEE